MPEEAPARAYSQSAIMKRRAKVIDGIFEYGLHGQQLLSYEFDRLVKLVRHVCRITESQARQTLMEFAEAEMNNHTIDRIATKLAGSYLALKAGGAVGVFAGLTQPEWAPVEISELRYGAIKNGRLFYDMRLMVMAGTAVGEEIRQAFPSKFVVPVLSRSLGWTLKERKPTHSELVRMWFNARLLVEDGRMKIDEFKCTSSQQKYNKALKERRSEPCIRQYRQQCRSCPIGYSECDRGTHRYTWLHKACNRCHREDAPFDPSEPGVSVCLVCRTKRARSYARRERSM